MHKPRIRTQAAICLAALALAALPAAADPVDPAFTYQGQLAQSGEAYTGTADFRVRPYDRVSGGLLVGQGKHGVAGPAELERPRPLEVLALEQHLGADHRVDRVRGVDRRAVRVPRQPLRGVTRPRQQRAPPLGRFRRVVSGGRQAGSGRFPTGGRYPAKRAG